MYKAKFVSQANLARIIPGPMIKALCNAIDRKSTEESTHMRVVTRLTLFVFFYVHTKAFQRSRVTFFYFFLVVDHVIIGWGIEVPLLLHTTTMRPRKAQFLSLWTLSRAGTLVRGKTIPTCALFLRADTHYCPSPYMYGYVPFKLSYPLPWAK